MTKTFFSKVLNLIFIIFIVLFLSLGIILHFHFDSSQVNLTNAFTSPSSIYIFGTDELGRDILIRTFEGISLSLRVSLLAWIASLAIGIILGTIAGYYKNSFADTAISGMITYAYATPFLIFMIALLGVIGAGMTNAYIVLVLFAWASPARQTRVIVSSIRQAKYVIAAQSYGFESKRIITFVLLPQVLKPVLIASLAVMPEIIALDTGLSFFGLGVQPPLPSLGKMIADGINYISVAWWMCVFPVLFLSVICLMIRYISNYLSRYIYE